MSSTTAVFLKSNLTFSVSLLLTHPLIPQVLEHRPRFFPFFVTTILEAPRVLRMAIGKRDIGSVSLMSELPFLPQSPKLSNIAFHSENPRSWAYAFEVEAYMPAERMVNDAPTLSCGSAERVKLAMKVREGWCVIEKRFRDRDRCLACRV